MDNDSINEFGDNRIFTFADSFAMQKPYREKFAEWLRSRPKVKEVKEASLKDDLAGTDFFVIVDDDQTYTVQVTYAIQLKTDFKADKTGNLPVETISQAYSWRDSVIGAEFKMSHVDYIFFLLIPSGRILGYSFKQFLEYVIEHYRDFRNFTAKNYNGGVQYITLGCLVPIRKVNHLAIFQGSLI